MIALPDPLEQRVRVAAAELVYGLDRDPDRLVRLGEDLLKAGAGGDAVVELASFRRGAPARDVEPVVRRALAEIGRPVPGPEASTWALALHWAKELQRGGALTYPAAAALLALSWSPGTPEEIGILVLSTDMWEEAVDPEDLRRIEEELRLHAPPIIAMAERELRQAGP